MLCSKGCKKFKGGIGYSAAKAIGEKLEGKIQKPIRSVCIGGAKFPLGRYLTKVVNESAGISDEQMWEDFSEYQEDLFDMFMANGENFDTNLRDSVEGKVRRKEKLNHLFGRKETL